MHSSCLQYCIDLPLEKEVLTETVEKAKDWALMHGISMRSKEHFTKDNVQIAPFLLLPTSFPKQEFEKAIQVQKILNKLMHIVAHDYDFLKKTLASTIAVDEFSAKLFHIYETVHAEGLAQDISIGLLRSDYMLHGIEDSKIKQIELNTIASSFAGIATRVTQFHRYILTELEHSDKLINVPENNAVSGLCAGLIEAWKLYNNEKAVILFVVENVTHNICDQRFHEFEIRRQNPKIRIIRKNLTEIISQAQLGPDKELIIGNNVISVVYFRSGYTPNDYPTEREWSARLLIERSRAMKCPTIHYHLAGTKKVQQALAQPGALDHFIKDGSIARQVQEIFTGLYSLDFNEYGDQAIDMALAEPRKFVLKPQREGGGNNVYDENIRTQLNSMKESKERTAWILMDRIYPPLQKNYIIRPGDMNNCEVQDFTCELGIYGIIIGNAKEIKVNKQVGHVLRTKPATATEGGVVMGIGALDSPYLVI
ncbi:glutathione synthetase-like [Cephus cinctus]|uniref:Glutathione synthetase n=1 Tax=Cephus cinctus TaxID=211228 RepID=A0AAJ7C3Z6_CEPCN|nr:glutathione synthetase-like [Cephus cinctus]XP_015601405.1 glutathione synthetase-like [Cephus cinctus]